MSTESAYDQGSPENKPLTIVLPESDGSIQLIFFIHTLRSIIGKVANHGIHPLLIHGVCLSPWLGFAFLYCSTGLAD